MYVFLVRVQHLLFSVGVVLLLLISLFVTERNESTRNTISTWC